MQPTMGLPRWLCFVVFWIPLSVLFAFQAYWSGYAPWPSALQLEATHWGREPGGAITIVNEFPSNSYATLTGVELAGVSSGQIVMSLRLGGSLQLERILHLLSGLVLEGHFVSSEDILIILFVAVLTF
jgi:hypothetical protein